MGNRLILSEQQRLMRLGNLRAGDQQPDRKGTLRPHRLEHWRLTSPSRELLEAAAAIYGGEVTPWPEAPGGEQWQLYSTSDVLEVAVPPGARPYAQHWERWGAGGWTHRCDGRNLRMVTKDGEVVESACLCDQDAPECDAVTRVNLILPRVPGLGTWLLTSTGMNAALELPAALDALGWFHERGRPVAGRLRLEQRTVKKQGEKFPRQFAVPVLDLDVTIGELMAGEVLDRPSLPPPGAPRELPSGDGGTGNGAPAPPVPATNGAQAEADSAPPPLSDGARRHLFAAAREKGVDSETVRHIARMVLGHGVSEMAVAEMGRLEENIERYADNESARQAVDEWIGQQKVAGEEPARQGDSEDPKAPDGQGVLTP